MFETVFDMGLLPGQRLQSPKLRFSGLMLLPTGVKDGQFERIGLFRSISSVMASNLRTSWIHTVACRISTDVDGVPDQTNIILLSK